VAPLICNTPQYNTISCPGNDYSDRLLENGVIPHGLCSQMDRYMHDLKNVLQQSLPEDEFGELHDVLAVAYQVEHIDQELPAPVRRGSKYSELDIAAGKFRAIAQRLKATRS